MVDMAGVWWEWAWWECGGSGMVDMVECGGSGHGGQFNSDNIYKQNTVEYF